MPPFDPIEELLSRLTDGGAWPPRNHARAWREVAKWRAFLENDRDKLKALADWHHGDRPYKVDPLGERIAEAWADYLYGDEPVITASVEADGPRYQLIADENNLADELADGERRNVGEGEVWWRCAVDKDVADVPLLEFHSRGVVAPLFVGRRLAAAALVTTLAPRTGKRGVIYRHLECHTAGRVEHVLFAGTPKRIGAEVDLDQHPDTADLDETWPHGLPMLMGRVLNKRGRTFDLGRSDFHGIADYLFELNEALTIGGENMRLTAKKRIVAPASSPALRPRAGLGVGVELLDRGDGTLIPSAASAVFAAGEDVLISDPLDDKLGEGTDPYRVLEYSYDAEALIAHKRDLVETAISRVGLTAQAIGVGDPGGYAISGTAVRLRFIPTDRAGARKGRPWDRTNPHVLSLLAQLDNLPEDDGGFGREWAAPQTPPTVERAKPLPPDEVEEAQVDQALISAGARSPRTSIRRQHPDWSDAEITAELEAIAASRPATPTGF